MIVFPMIVFPRKQRQRWPRPTFNSCKVGDNLERGGWPLSSCHDFALVFLCSAPHATKVTEFSVAPQVPDTGNVHG
jgi:hypothetical protein